MAHIPFPTRPPDQCADHSSQSAMIDPPRKKLRTEPRSRSASPRRRAPPLERLPRWLFSPRRQFVAAQGELPLPKKVAVRGKPFYDWDAWACALLAPDLWRRRGPWQRLIASCVAAKPPHVDKGHMPDVKAALVRIVVAEVVSQLVSRSEDQLTPEDRNWITSVASRQRGRHAKKPTLMLLFDLAFSVFDLAKFCRTKPEPSSAVVLKEEDRKERARESIAVEIGRIVVEAASHEGKEEKEMMHTDSKSKRGRSMRPVASVDPVVMQVLQVVHKHGRKGNEALIESVVEVIDEVEKLLVRSKAQRWHQYYVSKADACRDSLMQAARDFSRRMPLTQIKSSADLKKGEHLSEWLHRSLDGDNWACWAEFANVCNHIIVTGSTSEETLREDACTYIVQAVLTNCSATVDAPLLEEIVRAQLQYDDTKLTVRRLLDVALCLEKFYSFFIETHGKCSAVGPCINWGVLCFEGLVQLLGRLRDVLILGSSREKAMINWSARSLDIASYYREMLVVSPRMCDDINRAIQNAFAEASWPLQTRAMRFMIAPGVAEGTEPGASAAPQFWLANFDLSDPLLLAAAVVPWDPQRSIELLDRAIGLTPEAIQKCWEGNEGLPLWDYRRVGIFRLLSLRGFFPQSALIMERLQPLFDQKIWQEGGNFSARTIPLLEAAMHEGNICAQTTYGLLLAGQGDYWDVARSWANCESSIAAGLQKLYLSAVAGDLEACTALSHILAQSGSDNTSSSVFKHVAIDQVYTLFKIAVTTQNSNAVLNLGVLWRYGVGCVEQNNTIAIDAFLMALQGGIFGEARAVAAKHLAEAIGASQGEVSEVLTKLTSCDRAENSSASSPYRIDDFCETTQ